MQKEIRGAYLVTIVSLIALLAGAMFLFTSCAPKPSAQDSPAKSDTTEVDLDNFTWSEDSNCAMCHKAEDDSYTNSECLLSLHTSTTCTSCHVDFATLSEVHSSAANLSKQATRLKETTVSEDVCLECHPDYDELAKKTVDVVALTDKNGLLVNPHDLPDTEQHEQFITCSSCHKMHDGSESTEEQAKALCLSCHHANVYECNTCH